MKSRFHITHAGHLKAAKTFYIEGTVEGGVVVSGSVGRVEGVPEQQVVVKSVALVNAKDAGADRLTLSIQAPAFPVAELIGKNLIID